MYPRLSTPEELSLLLSATQVESNMLKMCDRPRMVRSRKLEATNLHQGQESLGKQVDSEWGFGSVPWYLDGVSERCRISPAEPIGYRSVGTSVPMSRSFPFTSHD